MGESNSCQGRSKLDNWWGADIRIFMFTHIKTTDFKRNELCRTRIYKISAPPPNYRACYGPGVNVLWTLLINSEYAYTPTLMINPLGASCSKAN